MKALVLSRAAGLRSSLTSVVSVFWAEIQMYSLGGKKWWHFPEGGVRKGGTSVASAGTVQSGPGLAGEFSGQGTSMLGTAQSVDSRASHLGGHSVLTGMGTGELCPGFSWWTSAVYLGQRRATRLHTRHSNRLPSSSSLQ